MLFVECGVYFRNVDDFEYDVQVQDMDINIASVEDAMFEYDRCH